MRSRYAVGLVFLVFFVISLLTNVQGPLIPDIKQSFGLSDSLVANLPLAFFGAYGVMSTPAGVLVDRYDARPVMLGSFILALAGCAAFVIRPTYDTVLGLDRLHKALCNERGVERGATIQRGP